MIARRALQRRQHEVPLVGGKAAPVLQRRQHEVQVAVAEVA